MNILPVVIDLNPFIFLGLREVWVVLFLLIIIARKNLKLIKIYVLAVILFACISLALNINQFNGFIFYYGFRDMLFIATIPYLLSLKVEKKTVKNFIHVVFLLATIQIVLSFILSNDQLLNLLKINEYYESKGVKSNVYGGITGIRLIFPFYSSGLLGMFFTLSFLFFKGRKRIISTVFALLTASKVAIMVPGLYLIRKSKILLTSVLIFIFIVFPAGIEYALKNVEVGFWSFHLSSIKDRFSILDTFNLNRLSFQPDLLGTNSVAGYVLSGRDPSLAPESLIIARGLDFQLYFPFFVLLLLLLINSLKGKTQHIFTILLITLIFTNLSNHPIAFIPLLLIKNDE